MGLALDGPVGKLVDDSVGLLEGARVGDAVGLALDGPAGKLVDDSVGLLEGARDVVVGRDVGSLDGIRVVWFTRWKQSRGRKRVG